MGNRQILLQKPNEIEFEVLRNSNDWLLDYRGKTYSEKLQYNLTRGLFEEHAKKADIGYANIEKAMVFNLDPVTKEIISLGGSSLLRQKKSDKIFESVLQSLAFKHRKIIPDLILDNFGLMFSLLISNNTGVTLTVKDVTNTSKTIKGSNATASNFLDNEATYIQMGSGSTAPARSDVAIQTALGSAPENAKIVTNLGAYTVSNTVIYQSDANPTGGSGTVNEIASIFNITDTTPALVSVAMAHDAVSPGVSYVAGKLLRGAYTWQL